MKRRVAVVAATSSFAVALVMGLSWRGPALAGAQARTVDVPPAIAAWYSEAGPCVSVLDCSTVPPANPYPEDTLHVSLSSGQETARTYLAFSLPAGGRITDGRLTLPLDTNPQDGSLSPDQADIVACLVTEGFQPVRGSLASPPAVNCDTSAGAFYDDNATAFTVDLSAFASSWDRAGTGALALLSTRSAQQGNGSWHVVFPAAKDADKPISASVTFTVPSSSGGGTSSGGGVSTGGTAPGASTGGGTFTGGGGVSGYGSFGSPSTSTTTTTTVTQVPGQPAAQAVEAQYIPGFAGSGFAYPLVWALPLVFFAGFGALGRALTKELYRRGI